MYIRSIELTNVQKWVHLVINLRQGINMLWAKTGAGKTCIIRALIWIMTNNFSSKDIRRDGTKITIVKLIISDVPNIKGDIEVSRTVSNSINRYEIKYPDKEELVVHDSVGKTIPEEVANLFALPIMNVDKEELVLNIQSQLDRHFLVTDKGTFRSKVFNKLTNNDLLDKVAKAFNSDLLGLNKTEKLLKGEIKEKTTECDSLNSEIEINKLNYKTNNAIFINLKAQQEELDDVEEVYNKLKEIRFHLKNVKLERADIEIPDTAIVPELRAQIDKFTKIQGICANLLKNRELLSACKQKKGKPIPELPKGLEDSIKTLEIVVKIAHERTSMEKRRNTLIERKSALKGEIKGLIVEYKELASKIPTIKCPNCNFDVKEYEAKEIS